MLALNLDNSCLPFSRDSLQSLSTIYCKDKGDEIIKLRLRQQSLLNYLNSSADLSGTCIQ